MTNFFIKKNFCDGWDSFFLILFSNIVSLAVLTAGYFIVSSCMALSRAAGYISLVFASGIVMIFIFPWGINARKIADFAVPGFNLYIKAIRESFFTAFAFGALTGLFIVVVRIAILYYLALFFKSGSYVGLFFAALLIWFTLVSLIAIQWFIPLYYLQDENTFIKCLKKSFIIFFDNAGFSVFVFIYNILLLTLSFVTFLLVPGVNGLILSCTNALRLRLYKYDWMEENPSVLEDKDKRSEVPWDDLLRDDVEALGPRKLSSFIFPWK